MTLFAAKITLILLMKCDFRHEIPELRDDNRAEYSKILGENTSCKLNVLIKRGK